MSDAYGKGIVRGQAENTNLRCNGRENDVSHAETFRTSQTESFSGKEYLKVIETLNDQKPSVQAVSFCEIDARNPRRRKITIRDVSTLYGQRPKHEDIWHLSPYEFVMYWEPVMCSYPLTLVDEHLREHHVRLTETGRQKLAEEGKPELIPGTDYVVKEEGGISWLPFPHCASTQHFRHTWVLVRRMRPRTPAFFGAPVPRHQPGEQQRAAAIVMAYFHPWTLRHEDADEHVKYAGHLRADDETWQDALEVWLDGNVICQEAARYVGNFLSVHRMRPRDDDDSNDGNSQDIASDEELEISRHELADALTTRIGGKDNARDDADQTGGPTHFQNSTAAIALNQSIWQTSLDKECATVPRFVEPETLQVVLDAARASQKREHMYTGALDRETSNPTLAELVSASAKDVKVWLDKKRTEVNEEGRLVLNTEQFKAVEKIAKRVMQELRHAANGDVDFGEPLRWLVHGGPGTGKSHVIKQIKELFKDVLKWDTGVEYQVVALQAVMADQLGGDTIHHACGIPVRRRGENSEHTSQKQMEIAKRILQWRWLIIDEISMVSAKLFAEIDVKLRGLVGQVGTQKHAPDACIRPFGGLNVLCCGDFWQLPPPDGGFLGSIPAEFIKASRKYQVAPTIAHGQALFWSGPETGIQGVSELVEVERCKDEWLREVQEEFRKGCLSKDNHKFLHGLPTKVPGSWVGKDVSCKTDACRQLATAHLDIRVSDLRGKRKIVADPSHIAQHECGVCRDERKRRCRVAQNLEVFKTEPFASAPAIFANNDVKYDNNKKRAEQYANDKNLAMTFVAAKDKPSHDAIREKPGIAAEKLSWLQRHDKESGDLYGILPLVHGMPVALTDHIDRNPQKQLLRGKIGYVHSWVTEKTDTSEFQSGVRILEKLPKTVFVKYEDAEWTLDGLTEKGLYPVCPKTSHWFLDKGRQHPKLKIHRKQLPLAPAFAITAHASQGQTLRAAIVDLQIGSGTSPISSYVALTRVRKCDDLLIYRAFERELFTRGSPEGPELLLKVLRGEAIDWKAIEEKHTPSKRCVQCNFMVFKDGFQAMQWSRKDNFSCCKSCLQKKKDAGTPHECNNCHFWKGAEAFASTDLNGRRERRVCKDCVDVLQCIKCLGRKSKSEFSDKAWTHPKQRVCKECVRPEVERMYQMQPEKNKGRVFSKGLVTC